MEEAAAHAKGAGKVAQTHVVTVPDVRAIRERVGLSQQAFAKAYRIPLATLKGWNKAAATPTRRRAPICRRLRGCPRQRGMCCWRREFVDLRFLSDWTTTISMSNSKRHHFNPRYYLKRFENAGGAMWRLDKRTGKIVSGNNERFGFKNNWNNFQDSYDGYDRDWLENRLAEIDGFAAAIISKIVAGEFPADLQALGYAISFMQNHQPSVVHDLKQNFTVEVAEWSEDHIMVASVMAAMKQAHQYVPRSYFVWEIGADQEHSHFLTSSNPLIAFENKPSMLFPISSRHCLFMTNDVGLDDMQPRLFACDVQMVNEINSKTIENAWQYVYSCQSAFPAI